MPEPTDAAPAGMDPDIPGYREALAEEAEARDLAFLPDLPQPLCGVPVLPLDLRNLVLLTHAENPFVCGGVAGIEDVRLLLWVLSPLYRAGDEGGRQRFVDSLPPMQEASATAEVRAWIERTFADAPASKKRPKGTSKAVLEEPVASFVASWIDLFASEYSWDADYIVGTPQRRGIPLPQIYQLHRCIVRRHDPKHSFNSGLIAKVIGAWARSWSNEEKPVA